ncbi:hypothetical protein ES703_104673 [subsurface metagenome]
MRNCSASQRKFFFSISLTLKARSPKNCEFHSARQNSHGTFALPKDLSPWYHPRYIVQSQGNGTLYSHVKIGLTPTVAQRSNQSDISWTGAKFA